MQRLRSVIPCESVTEPGLSARYQQPLNHKPQPVGPHFFAFSFLATPPPFPLYHPEVSLGLVWLKCTHCMSYWSHPGLPGVVARDTHWVAQVQGETDCPVAVYAILGA